MMNSRLGKQPMTFGAVYCGEARDAAESLHPILGCGGGMLLA